MIIMMKFHLKTKHGKKERKIKEMGIKQSMGINGINGNKTIITITFSHQKYNPTQSGKSGNQEVNSSHMLCSMFRYEK